MSKSSNTARNTALSSESEVIVPFKTQKTAKKSVGTDGKTPKPRRTGGERGVWREHDTYAASAGKDPETGQRVRGHGFPTYEEAREWRAKEITRLATLEAERRQQLRKLAEHEAIAACRALDSLHKAGFSGSNFLEKAVDEWIRRHPLATPKTVRDFYKEWLEMKVKLDRRDRTLQSAISNFKLFLERYGDIELTDVTIVEIDDAVFDESSKNATTRRNRGTAIKNFFNEAALRGYIGKLPTDNPCNALRLPDKVEPEPEPWTIDEYRSLLKFAWATEDVYHATAFIALGGLAGVRTEELARLRFCREEIDLDRGLVRVPKEKAKKKRTRTVKMEPGLLRLLRALRDRPRIRRKHVRPLPRPTDPGSRVFSVKAIKDFKHALLKPEDEGGAGFPVVKPGGKKQVSKKGKVSFSGPSAWRDNGLRASYATYHFERGGDARDSAGKMGHTGRLDIFFEYYCYLAQPGEGHEFFGIPDEILD